MEIKVNNLFESHQFEINLKVFKSSDLHYKDIIGIGGFGMVSKAQFLNKTIAIKTTKFNNQNILAKELLTLKCLAHPGIPALYGITEKEVDDTLGIIYEYIDGDTLTNFLHANKLNDIEILLHLIDLANVLIYLHGVRLIHRDLKPENIMIDKNTFELKIIDFGISKFTQHSHTLSMIQGTYMYMAPELFTSQTDSIINCTIEKCYVSDKVDIFSFGVILNEIFGNDENHCNKNKDPLHIMGHWLGGGRFPVSEKIINIKIKKLVKNCTQNNPKKRPNIISVKYTLQSILLDYLPEFDMNYFNKLIEKKSNKLHLYIEYFYLNKLHSNLKECFERHSNTENFNSSNQINISSIKQNKFISPRQYPKYCPTCNIRLCSFCSASQKNNTNTDLILKLLDKCDNHGEDKVSNFFCKSCNMSICLNCKLSFHINHFLLNNNEPNENDHNITICDYLEIKDYTHSTAFSDSFINRDDYSIISSNIFGEIFQADDDEITSHKDDFSIYYSDVIKNNINGPNNKMRIFCILLLPNGYIVSSSNDNLKICDPSNKFEKVKEIKGLKYPVYSLALISNEVFATGSMETIKFYNISKDYQCVGNINKAHDNIIYSLLLLNNGNLVSASNGLIKIWDRDSDYFDSLASLNGHKQNINCLLQLFDGKLASASSDKTIRIWLVNKKYKCIKKINAHEGRVQSLLLLPNGSFVSGSYDKAIKVWDCKTDYSCILTITEHENAVRSLILLPGNRIVSGSYDKTIRIWELSREVPKCLKVLKEGENWVTAMVVLTNGNLVSSSWTNGLKLWKC
jgi:serine/threonine protein kinase